MKEEDLHLKLATCAFNQTEVEYLGLMVRNGEVLMDPTKLKAVEQWEPLRSVKVVVKDASLTLTYSFLPASWVGDTHEETNFLPISNREEKEEQCLNRRTDSLEAM